MPNGTVISILNHKGGCGKTTTAINLGHALARMNIKTLVVDADLQCNSTSNLFSHDRLKYSLFNVLNPEDGTISVSQCIFGTLYENLSLLPNSGDTAALEQKLIQHYPEGMQILRDRFRDYAKDNFDVVLIDNQPSLGSFVMNSLMASDFGIVPCETGSKYSLEGLSEAVSFIEDIRQTGATDIKFLKVLLTKTDQRKLAHRATITQIRNHYPAAKVFKTFIPTNTDFQKAELRSETIFSFRSNATGAIAYRNLAMELLDTLRKGE
jgi:chromosome partitioning protein